MNDKRTYHVLFEEEIRSIGEDMERYAIETLCIEPETACVMRDITEQALRNHFGVPRTKKQ